MLRLNQVKIRTDHSRAQLLKKAAELLRIPAGEILEMKILRQSVDARSEERRVGKECRL